MNFAILASTQGSNLPSLFLGFDSGRIQGEIVCTIVNKKECGARLQCENKNIPTYFCKHENKKREDYDLEMTQILEKHNVDYIICVGFMRILSGSFVKHWENKILNVHPSFLPEFPGAHAIHDALKSGASQTGATIHYIDEGVDTGAIIQQERVPIYKTDTLDILKKRIQQTEQKLYVEVLEKLSLTKSLREPLINSKNML